MSLSPEPHAARPRRRTWLRVSAWVAGTAVVSLLIAVFVLWNIPQPGPGSSDRASGPVGSPPEASVEGRRSFLSLGHTSSAVPAPVTAPDVIDQRMPFQLTVPADRYRIVIRNIDYLADLAAKGTLSVTSVYAGVSAGDGRFAEPAVALVGETELAGSGFLVSDWIDADNFPVTVGDSGLLGVTFAPRPGATLGVNPGVGWVHMGAPRDGDGVGASEPGTFTRAGAYLDIQIEYAFDDADRTVPVVAVIGHSLNAGANQNPDVPHAGEESSWHQQWALAAGGSAASLAAAGAWTPNFVPDSPKWRLATAVDPDVVTIWSSSSDLVSGTSPADVGAYWEQVVDEARARWPRAWIVAFTEPPRVGAEGIGETNREEWNAFLRTIPGGIDAVVDTDAALADPKDPHRLNPAWNGDGSHLSPTGNAKVASLFEETLAKLREDSPATPAP